MALFRGIQEYIALDANNITLVFDSGNIVNISGNIFLYPPQGHPILYNCTGLQSCNLFEGMVKVNAKRSGFLYSKAVTLPFVQGYNNQITRLIAQE